MPSPLPDEGNDIQHHHNGYKFRFEKLLSNMIIKFEKINLLPYFYSLNLEMKIEKENKQNDFFFLVRFIGEDNVFT